MIHPEKGKHENHPGHDNGDCHLRITVNAHLYGTSHNGYACSATGGHCIKSDACAQRAADDKKYQEENKDLLAFLEKERAIKDTYLEAQQWHAR